MYKKRSRIIDNYENIDQFIMVLFVAAVTVILATFISHSKTETLQSGDINGSNFYQVIKESKR